MTDALPMLPTPYFLARPAHSLARPGAGVVVIQEGGGITPQLLRVCERLARDGYLVIAPDIFHHLGGPGGSPNGDAYRLIESTDALRDIGEVVDVLRSLGAARIGVTGFCQGGRFSYETATSDIDIQCAVPFYGGGIGARLGTPRCPTLLLYGGKDEHITPEEIATVQAHHGDDQVVVYPDAGHGFFRDGSDAYDAEAADDAWHRLTGMFAAHLG